MASLMTRFSSRTPEVQKHHCIHFIETATAQPNYFFVGFLLALVFSDQHLSSQGITITAKICPNACQKVDQRSIKSLIFKACNQLGGSL